MKTTFVSSQAVANATRLSMMKMQTEIARQTQQLASGRWADVGLTLGYRTGHTVEMRQEITRVETILDTNGLVSARLNSSQAAVDGLRETASEMAANLIALRGNAQAAKVAGPQAALNLKALAGALNADLNGQFLFAGINTDAKPFVDYDATPVSPAKAAIDAAFTGYFGFPQTSPAVATITPAAMTTFVRTVLPGQFADPAWGNNWSTASDTSIKSRISTNDLIDTSVTANERGFRKLAMAYTMLSDLGGPGLSAETFQAIVNEAQAVTGAAVVDLADAQARLGVAQNRVKESNERLEIQRDILNRQVLDLEAADPFETSARLNELMSQVEMSYSVTARIRQLSLLKFI